MCGPHIHSASLRRSAVVLQETGQCVICNPFGQSGRIMLRSQRSLFLRHVSQGYGMGWACHMHETAVLGGKASTFVWACALALTLQVPITYCRLLIPARGKCTPMCNRTVDTDCDNVPNIRDNCPTVKNPLQVGWGCEGWWLQPALAGTGMSWLAKRHPALTHHRPAADQHGWRQRG